MKIIDSGKSDSFSYGQLFSCLFRNLLRLHSHSEIKQLQNPYSYSEFWETYTWKITYAPGRKHRWTCSNRYENVYRSHRSFAIQTLSIWVSKVFLIQVERQTNFWYIWIFFQKHCHERMGSCRKRKWLSYNKLDKFLLFKENKFITYAILRKNWYTNDLNCACTNEISRPVPLVLVHSWMEKSKPQHLDNISKILHFWVTWGLRQERSRYFSKSDMISSRDDLCTHSCNTHQGYRIWLYISMRK